HLVAAVSHHCGLLDRAPQFEFEWQPPPGQRYGRTSHERKAQLAGLIVHPLRLLPVVREMLVTIDRHGAPGLPEHIDDLFVQLIARVQMLSLFVERVFAMLADERNAIDGETPATQAQCFTNRA